MNIFVSYAKEQGLIAERVIAHLRAGGHDVHSGSALFTPGHEFSARIREAIGRAELFVFLVSSTSRSSFPLHARAPFAAQASPAFTMGPATTGVDPVPGVESVIGSESVSVAG